jgi:hypothetical protein
MSTPWIGQQCQERFAGLPTVLKRFARISNCRLSGLLVPSSQERTEAVAMPILVAKW